MASSADLAKEVLPLPATIKDVAALAEVSIKTVSRVLNDEPYVSYETQQRVHDAVKMLAYSRNEAAVRLRRGKRKA
jgi:LacI family transcriptional regulator